MAQDPALILKQAPGIFTFNSTVMSGYTDVHNQIPRQVLTLTSYRIEFTGADDTAKRANSLAAQNLYVKFPFISSMHVIDEKDSLFAIVVPLDDAAVTFANGLSQKFWMSHDVHDQFYFRIVNEAGTEPTTIARIVLQFQFDLSATS
jgi:hypothetical protein